MAGGRREPLKGQRSCSAAASGERVPSSGASSGADSPASARRESSALGRIKRTGDIHFGLAHPITRPVL